MRKYWIKYWRDFGNTYNLCWTDGDDLESEGWRRITRKEAESKAREERAREKYDSAFSGFADSHICKHGYIADRIRDGNPIIVEVSDCSQYYD